MKDARGQSKAERQYYDRQNLQACIVCGRLFTRRVAKVCSITCQSLKDLNDGKGSEYDPTDAEQ
jgi:hypothetical protein